MVARFARDIDRLYYPFRCPGILPYVIHEGGEKFQRFWKLVD